MSLNNVAIVGASGNLGRLVLPELLESQLNLAAVIRETSSANFPMGIRVIKSAFDVTSLTQALKGQDAVISMLPITALDQQGPLIEAAIAAGVKRFIPSEYGSDSTSPAVVAAVPFFDVKKKYIELLSSKEDVMSWTALITGPFFDWTFSQGLTGFDLSKRSVTLVDEGKTRFTASSVAQIGRALVSVLANPTGTANKMVYMESFTTTQLEILAAVEMITGEEWTVVNVRSEDIRAEGFRKVGEGNVWEGGSALIQAAVLGKQALEDHTHVEGGIWNDRLGLKGESLEETLKKVFQSEETNR